MMIKVGQIYRYYRYIVGKENLLIKILNVTDSSSKKNVIVNYIFLGGLKAGKIIQEDLDLLVEFNKIKLLDFSVVCNNNNKEPVINQ